MVGTKQCRNLEWWLQESIKGCTGLHSRSNQIVALSAAWFVVNLFVLYLSLLPKSSLIFGALVTILTSEGIFSTPLAMRGVANKSGDKIYNNLNSTINKNFPDGKLKQDLYFTLSKFQPTISNKYNHFYPFKNWKKEAEGSTYLNKLLQDLASIC